MKKVLIIFVILLLVGCGKKEKLVCEKNAADGYSYTEEVIPEFNGNIVSKVKNTLTFNDLIEATVYCESLKNYKDYEIDNLDYECDNKVITINNFEVLTDLDTKITGISKEEFISVLTENQYACK